MKSKFVDGDYVDRNRGDLGYGRSFGDKTGAGTGDGSNDHYAYGDGFSDGFGDGNGESNGNGYGDGYGLFGDGVTLQDTELPLVYLIDSDDLFTYAFLGGLR